MAIIQKFRQQFDLGGKFILDAIAPLRCLGCKRIGMIACADCLAKVKIELKATPGPEPIQTTVTVANFDEPLVQKLIHALKYDGIFSVSDILAEWLISNLQNFFVPDDELIPIPLHPTRQRERGFNQSELMAKKLSREFNIPTNQNLKRIRNTKPQVECTGEERRTNLKEAFVYQSDINAKRIILLDDVTTTGSTFLEAALAIRKFSQVPIIGITVARG
ncbi:MAG: ComF family protein [Patescibacteria group bacterium]|jgi:ComF family protein